MRKFLKKNIFSQKKTTFEKISQKLCFSTSQSVIFGLLRIAKL